MAHRLAPAAEADLDAIWYYIATESGSVEIADRLIDSITERFFLLAAHPHTGRRREDLRGGLRNFAGFSEIAVSWNNRISPSFMPWLQCSYSFS
jgi:plasmid stabilization system protein ParE